MAKVGGDDFGGFGGFGGGGTQPPDGEKKEGAEPLEEEEGRVEPAEEGQEGGEGEEELEIPASAEGSLGSLEEDGTQHLSLAERLLTEEMNIKYVCVACGITCMCAMHVLCVSASPRRPWPCVALYSYSGLYCTLVYATITPLVFSPLLNSTGTSMRPLTSLTGSP